MNAAVPFPSGASVWFTGFDTPEWASHMSAVAVKLLAIVCAGEFASAARNAIVLNAPAVNRNVSP